MKALETGVRSPHFILSQLAECTCVRARLEQLHPFFHRAKSLNLLILSADISAHPLNRGMRAPM